MSFFKDKVQSAASLEVCITGNNAEDAITAIKVVPAANSADAYVMTVSNAALGQASVISIPDPGAATSKFVLQDGTNTTATIATLVVSTSETVSGAFQQSFQALTAGTTQTQAGATAITKDIVQVTTGNASDGLILPALSAGQIGRTIRIINASANAGVLYCPGTTSTNTINGTAGATGVAYAASKMLTCVAVSATAWVTTLSN